MNTSTFKAMKTIPACQVAARRSHKYLSGLLTAITLVVSTIGYTDDTEIYLEETNLPAEQKRPNVVFVLDTSGSMNYPISGAEVFGWDEAADRYADAHPTTYPGDPNYSGGAGDSNYYYLYNKQYYNYGGSGEPTWVYFNKVHVNQIALCDTPTVNDSTPFDENPDRYVYNTGAVWNTSAGGTNDDASRSDPLCAWNDSSCGFTPGPTGPLVDCKSEENRVTQNSRYPTDNAINRLYLVSANFHNYLQSYHRYTILQKVMRDLIDEGYDINMALMDFNGVEGADVTKESVLATDSDSQTALRSAVDRMIFAGGTPLTESLWEALLYLRGETVDQGVGSVAAATTGTGSSMRYISPIEYACQESHIVMLTDGTPSGPTSGGWGISTNDSDRDSLISSLTGTSCSTPYNATIDEPGESCMDDLAQWIYEDAGGNYSGSYSGFTGTVYTRGTQAGDQRDHVDNNRVDASTGLMIGAQTIQVHTVGFGLDPLLLRQTANNGGGISSTASTATELADAFRNILAVVDFESDTNVAPAVAVNAYSGLQHRDELYFALFKPQASPRWNGNIKKYRLNNGVVVDANGNSAINSGTGFFEDSAESYWWTLRDLDHDGDTSDEVDPDGGVIEIGGVATNLTTPTTRRMYTYTGSSTTGVSMTGEALDTGNTVIAATPTLLGPTVTTDERADSIITWARGGDSDALASYYFPDIIHNPPVVVTYETATSGGSCSTISPCFTDVLYAGTNMGSFHSINPENGSENWSFIPKELLPNLTAYYDQSGGFTNKFYGLDGKMQVWRYDAPDEDGIQDGNISAASGDHVYIYQPQRRGGTNLYAFNVTDRDSPTLMWQIVGTGLDATPAGPYQDLAQTWSSPQRTKINWCSGGSCSIRTVLFFGGGYDPVHDDTTSAVSSSKGNAIYMVDATSGERLWSAGDGTHHSFDDPLLANSFAADVTVGDVDGDELVDLLYAVDVQGNVWRFDFDNTVAAGISAGEVDGGRVAQLSSNSGSDFRRFYNAPDIAFFTRRGQDPMLTISIPSGYRAHPRDVSINDYLFVLFDRHATSHPTSYSTITDGNLGAPGTPTASGWKYQLTATGEKGLSRTITFNGMILMTTYIPEFSNTCIGTTGSGRFYLLNALSGLSELPDTSEGAEAGDTVAFQALDNTGIPPEPVLIFGKGEETCLPDCETEGAETVVSTKITACVGTECFSTPATFSASRAYWRENQ